ncbi:hypothetical protein BRAT_19635 [Leptospira interrogans serovar Bratislava]|uniref:Uncharacterized protein n=3 Tax=Leptospira interrogans TaxID=173 RepID=M3CHG1_LEPIR|nr:hypothetical protein BRAT_19635 [Leptospira interrogans serovar Bratislava]EMF40844.1 hypothetical protein LEP1GSC067_2257 [Leptospira interrogans serovar Lora str. TE 1992]
MQVKRLILVGTLEKCTFLSLLILKSYSTCGVGYDRKRDVELKESGTELIDEDSETFKNPGFRQTKIPSCLIFKIHSLFIIPPSTDINPVQITRREIQETT